MTSPAEMAGYGTWETIRTRGIGLEPRPRRLPQKPKTLREAIYVTPKGLQDPFLRDVQKAYDRIYFDKKYGLEFLPRSHKDAKAEHIGKHIGKTSVKLFRYLQQPADNGTAAKVRTKVLGDLAMYRTQLANTLAFNLQTRLGPVTTDEESPRAAYDVLQDAVEAAADFGENIEHAYPDGTVRTKLKEAAVPALHMSALILANHFETTVYNAHLNRLAVNVGAGSVS